MTKAPFTDEQVKNLNDFQAFGRFHPFTCGGNRSSEAHRAYAEVHGGDLGQLVATNEGWRCPVCDYRQDWAHGFMADTTAESLRQSNEPFVPGDRQPQP